MRLGKSLFSENQPSDKHQKAFFVQTCPSKKALETQSKSCPNTHATETSAEIAVNGVGWGGVIPAIGGVNIRQDVSPRQGRPGGRNMLAAVTFSKI